MNTGAAESTINTISLIVIFPIMFSNYFSKKGKKKLKKVPNDSKQYEPTGLIHRKGPIAHVYFILVHKISR